jgi:hypothetical protein
MAGDINSTNENIEALLVTKLYVNAEKTGYMFMSQHHSGNKHTANKSKWEWQLHIKIVCMKKLGADYTQKLLIQFFQHILSFAV